MALKISFKKTVPKNGGYIHFKTEGYLLDGFTKTEFSGKANQTLLIHQKDSKVLYVGVGYTSKISNQKYRLASATATKQLLEIGIDKVSINLADQSEFIEAIIEGAVLRDYSFDIYKASNDRHQFRLKEIVFVTEKVTSNMRDKAKKGLIQAEATNYTRQIGNLPGNVLYPETLSIEAKKLANRLGLKSKVWNQKALARDGFEGIISVGKGSAQEPRFITLEYGGGDKKQKPIALVGKAITFDSGGLSLKPGEAMDEMKFDKMGGVCVLGILKAIAEMKLPLNVVGCIAAAENMPSSTAYRPGDIISTYNKQTVEVLNTDAEGRIILADALSYACQHYQPVELFDFATLTGACLVALGDQRAGIFSTEKSLLAGVQSASQRSGEKVWPLPVGDEFNESIKSEIALVQNTGGRYGGACTAASFLKHWVSPEIPWMHLDIAGPAWNTKNNILMGKGATGFAVRLMIEYLKDK